ncbi:MAG: HAD-IC family P-type ATPase [Cyanobacteria bacterium RI_101]|nr:HAD-IC family P-type ATPase [Cyanobacteria bacterium RI_101]
MTSSSWPDPQTPWHTYGLAQSLERLAGDPQGGLTAAAVAERQRRYGLNELIDGAGRSSWEIFLDQFKNVMLVMLIAVAVVSGVLDIVQLRTGQLKPGNVPFKDTIAILAIVILNGVLGYLQESRAEKALAALKKLSSPAVQVIRDGQRQSAAAETLVPGDIMLLEAGSQLCADGVLIEAINLSIRESALTGEAQPVNKRVSETGLAADTPLGDRHNMVFTGTEVIQGRGKVLVTATGMASELGKIAQMLQTVESEPTPLQKRMGDLGNVLVSGSLILVALVITLGVAQKGWGLLQELVEVSLSMAVAVVPEGLPAVITVTLALGTQRMVRRQALIRKLPAVETLGSVNVICSDKTGTLTQNKMIVQEVVTWTQAYTVTGEGYNPTGEICGAGLDPDLYLLLLTCVLCNDAQLCYGQPDWSILGDPTEGALLTLAGKGGLFQDKLTPHWPRLAEIPFSSERKRMSVLTPWRGPQGEEPLGSMLKQICVSPAYGIFTKGSPELLLPHCAQVLINGETQALSPGKRQKILGDNDELARRGLRVLGLAYRPLAEIPEMTVEAAERDLVWLGMAGMIDAPRLEVKAAVAKCLEAGIRTVMITGDHQLTASVIAESLGISRPEDRVVTGLELERMSQADLEAQVEHISVFARVAPEHKLRIVQALQSRDKFVAMTGDGVNDAPALKQADIGIAMGITGTDVSKEASDMVLLDDNFATIVAATEEGRVVYSNIRHFIKYILGSNVGEVITIAAAPILGLSGVPLSPLQILWMNLVTDGLPALALAVEPGDPNIMKYRPFSPKESIFSRGLGSYILRIGLIFSAISITLMVWAYNSAVDSGRPDSWKTMVFTTLCIAQMGHALAVRSNTRLTVEMNPLTNIYLWGAVLITTALQLMLIYVEPLRNFFNTDILTPRQLLICLAFSSLMFLWVEGEKLAIRLYKFMKRKQK